MPLQALIKLSTRKLTISVTPQSRFELQKRSQFLIRAHDGTLCVIVLAKRFPMSPAR